MLLAGFAVLAIGCSGAHASREAVAPSSPAPSVAGEPTASAQASEGAGPAASTNDDTAPTPPPSTPTPSPPPEPFFVDSNLADQEWSLAFRDDFDGDSVDPERWTRCYWWDDGGCTNEGNNELQWYLPEQGTVADGVLHLTAEPHDLTTRRGDRYGYRSGMVTTGRDRDDLSLTPRFAFTYGLVEARVRVPHGAGLWPAIWLLPITHDSRPEIDIMETLGDSTDLVEFHVHTNGPDGQPVSPGQGYRSEELSSGWHVYSIDWSPEAIVWLVDGLERWRLETNVPDEPLYLLLNLAVGGDYAGPPDVETAFPADFEVDHVRVWQLDDPVYTSTGLAALDGDA